jgi:protein-S-isoprenylcysteine O-methyltransferase Ste14
MSLESTLVARVAIGLPVAVAALFLPAGSFKYWQGWASLGAILIGPVILFSYFLRHDRQLLKRRMLRREPRPEQRLWVRLWMPLWLSLFLLPGFDHRFGWSRTFLGGVPPWLSVLAQVLILGSWLLIFQVFRYNTFAASVIEVELGQKVISDGPYRIVRHPMYSAIVLFVLSAPLALGSYFALPLAVPLIALLVFRLLNEERVLLAELSGYPEYCQRTRFRLIPFAW